jgi:uncharacterized protein YaiE (UPF0345 family)
MINVNEYFDGKVKSLALAAEGKKATVGVMAPGEYEFGTSQHEKMQVISGVLRVQLPDQTEWKDFGPGNVFHVEAGKKFRLVVKEDTSYLCIYG